MNIAIIESNVLFRESLKTALNQISDFRVVLSSDFDSGILQMLSVSNVDVVLLDGIIGAAKKYEALKQIHALYPHIDILVMSDYPEQLYSDDVLREGASGVIFKHFGKRTIEKEIRRMVIHADKSTKEHIS